MWLQSPADVIPDNLETTTWANLQQVPLLAVPFTSNLEEIRPWLVEYILERERSWMDLPVAETWDADDSSLTARFAYYNLLRCDFLLSFR